MEKVIIDGNGAVKVNGRYVHYQKGEIAAIPEEIAKKTGNKYQVIKSKTAVVSKNDTENREFPKHKGGGNYVLSNGESVKGKENAIKAQSEIES